MFRLTSIIIAVLVAATAVSGCARNKLHSEQDRKMTVGLVQKEIRVGMDQAAVAAALGSPNIVTRDDKGHESWVYDKIATEASYKQKSSEVGGGLSGASVVESVLLLGTVGGSRSGSKGASATTQKTLTVIIRFDANSRVESFSYHSSTF